MSIDFKEYEKHKTLLRKKALSPEEYEKEIKNIIERMENENTKQIVTEIIEKWYSDIPRVEIYIKEV